MAKPPAPRTRLDRATRVLAVRLWRDFVRPHWRRLALALAAMALTASATGLYPLLIDWAVSLLSAKDSLVVTVVPPLVIAVTAVKAASLYAQSVLTSATALRVVADIQNAMFGNLTAADLARILRDTSGALISRFTNDLNIVREALSRVATNLVRDLLTAVVLVGAMFYLDWALALVVLALYPLASAPVIRIGRKLRSLARTSQEQMGLMSALLNESFGGARMVRAYRLEDYEKERAAKTFERTYELAFKSARNHARIDPLLEAVGGITIAGIIAFVGFRLISGASTIGEFSGFIAALLMAYQPIRSVGSLNAVLQQGLAACQRVFELLDERPRVVDKPDAKPLVNVRGAIAFRDVEFGYLPGVSALDGVTFEVKPGETVALVGPSGAGKSTVINLIPRLFDVRSGAITVDGNDIRDVTLASLRDAIALVSQDVVLFDDTVRANIAFGRLSASDAEIEQAARAAAAHEFIVAMPQGYATLVGERGGKLSGGQRQRLAIARAMLRNAPILLLDEATSSLDSESERQVQAALAALMRGRTTLVIAHRLSTVIHAGRILVLDKGRIVESGAHAELLAKGGLYARLYRTQFAGGETREPAQVRA